MLLFLDTAQFIAAKVAHQLHMSLLVISEIIRFYFNVFILQQTGYKSMNNKK
jgi:hypothetical protein